MPEAFTSADAATRAQQRVVDVVKLLLRARDAYYKQNSPIMQDSEYDALERELESTITKFPSLAGLAKPVLRQVGSDLSRSGRVQHTHPMLSIENKYEEQDLIDWYSSLPMATAVCLEPKFDGISVSLVYRNHRLVQALTRGDGASGEDITLQAVAVSSIPKKLSADLPADLEVRGELVMQNSTLAKLNQEAEAVGGKIYTSTRNLTGGTMKHKDMSVIPSRQILIMPWDVIGDDTVLPDSGLARLKLIVKAGFPLPLGNVVSDGVSVGTTLRLKLRDRETVLRSVLSLETDGVVIKVDSYKLRRKLGVASKYTNWQVCFKPQSASGTTYLREIVWQVGRTGKVSPVAVCDPVILAGAKVEHASLNNITWIQDKGLKLGAKVEMLRSGDVIPQIVRVLDEGDTDIVPPTHCPECTTLLIGTDEGGKGIIQHMCVNADCPGIVRQNLEFIGGREVLEIDGLGPEMAKKLATDGYARDLGQLFSFQDEAKAEMDKLGDATFLAKMRKLGFDATVVKMIKSLEGAKTAPWERWIKALGIDMVGGTLGKAIATHCDLQSGDFPKLPGILLAFTSKDAEGFGEAKMGAIRRWLELSRNHAICKELFAARVLPTPVEKAKVVAGAPLAGVAFCITGEFSEDRDSITKKLVSLGAAAKSGVSAKVNLLIVGVGAGKTKLSKAAGLGIQQVGNDWLVKTLSDNGLTLGSGLDIEEA